MASPTTWTWTPDDEQDITDCLRDLDTLRYRKQSPTVLWQIDVCKRALERMRALKERLT